MENMTIKKGGFKRKIKTGIWIRDALIKKGEAHIHELYIEHKRDLRSINKDYKTGEYQNFRTYFYVLRKLGLVEETRKEAPPQKANKPWLHDRTYYRVVKGREEDPAWQNPFKAAYG